MKTFRELRDKLNRLSDYQLDNDLAVEFAYSEECLSGVSGDIMFRLADRDNWFLDEGHPVIVVNF
jgi:hypothetical protein